MTTTAENATAVRPRDLQPTQVAAFALKDGDEFVAEVTKNTPKAGRLNVHTWPERPTGAQGEPEVRQFAVKYRDIETVELRADVTRPLDDGGGTAGTPAQRADLEERATRPLSDLSGSEAKRHAAADLDRVRERLAAGGTVSPKGLGVLREARAVGLDLEKSEVKALADDEAYQRLAEKFRTRGLPERDRQRMLKLAEQLGHRVPKGAAAKTSSASSEDGGKRRANRKPSAPRGQYPPEIREAVKLAKEIRAASGGSPGPKQHVAVRAELAKATGAPSNGGFTPDAVLGAVGMSERALRSAAKAPAAGGMSNEKFREQTGLREFGLRFDDPFCKGRNLASILAAYVAQLKAAS